jgi:hypothetical protein
MGAQPFVKHCYSRGPWPPLPIYPSFNGREPSFFLTMQDAINIIAISDKGKSRIGKKLTMAIVEQNHHDKMFIVIPGTNQCRWIKKDNDPDFRIISFDED